MVHRLKFLDIPIQQPHPLMSVSQWVPRLVCVCGHPRLAVFALPHVEPETLPEKLLQDIESANRHFDSSMLKSWEEGKMDLDNAEPDDIDEVERLASLDAASFKKIIGAMTEFISPVEPCLVRPGARLGRLRYNSAPRLSSDWIFNAELSENTIVVSELVANAMVEASIQGIEFVQVAERQGLCGWFEVHILRNIKSIIAMGELFDCTLCGQAGSSGRFEPGSLRFIDPPDIFRHWGRVDLYCSDKFRELYISNGWKGLDFSK